MLNEILTAVLGSAPKVAAPAEGPHSTAQALVSFHDFLRGLYLSHGAVWDEVNIFGLRDTSDMSRSVWNDFIGIATLGKVFLYRGTCDPSAYWTSVGGAATDKKGVAHICLGWYPRAYQVGYHGVSSPSFKHEALLQVGKVKIWRDGNNNFRQDDSDIIQEGWFGCNIHRASAVGKEATIGRYSAGCQVVQDPDDFKEFMAVIKASAPYLRGRRHAFGYLLMSIREVPEEYLRPYRVA